MAWQEVGLSVLTLLLLFGLACRWIDRWREVQLARIAAEQQRERREYLRRIIDTSKGLRPDERELLREVFREALKTSGGELDNAALQRLARRLESARTSGSRPSFVG